LTASIFDETKSITQKLYNVQKDQDTYLIKFVEPCPKVEWAGELNRDRHFVVNTNSNDPDNLDVSIFNPNHGQSKFLNLTSDRLENVFLYYREVGDIHWSKARTEIENDEGLVDSVTIDYAAEYAFEEENSYGFALLKWSLANKVPDGIYEIKIESECDRLGGPADSDSYSTPILSGVIDLTRPEQYGRALPLRESVLIGEEIVVVFTEPVRCEAFDLHVRIDDLDLDFDRNDPPIQIACDGRKVGFQIDPAQIDLEAMTGKSFSVEMGKLHAESKSNVFDLNGNAIENIVSFEKTFADIDLDQTSTSFKAELAQVQLCSNDTSSAVCIGEIKDKIASLLLLNSSDRDRIKVENVSNNVGEHGHVSATLTILPKSHINGGISRRLRHPEMPMIASAKESYHSVDLFRKLQSEVKENYQSRQQQEEGGDSSLLDKGRALGITNSNSKADEIVVLALRNMKIVPNDPEMKILTTTDPVLLEKEEELYRYASMTDKGGRVGSQSRMSEIDRKALIGEIDNNSRNREEAMMQAMFRELKEMKVLQIELTVLTLACTGISFVVFFILKR